MIAHPSLAGTEYCCDYHKPDDIEKQILSYADVIGVYVIVYVVVGVGCGLFWTFLPCCIGLCFYLHYRKKKMEKVHRRTINVTQVVPAAGVTTLQPAMAIAQPTAVTVQPDQVTVQPTIPRAVSIGVVDPAAQKDGLVVVQPVSI